MPKLQKEEVWFDSADGVSRTAGYVYTMPEVPVHAVLQLSHGMCEYIGRYEGMAEYFAARGIAVAGNDHIGHGRTGRPEAMGQFGPGGRKAVLQDLHTMNSLLHLKFPEAPVFLYGHSMGSFFARWYTEVYGGSIRGLVISGTAGPAAANKAGLALSAAIAGAKGESYISPLMIRLQGNYNKKIPGAKSPNAWLTRDEAVVQAYDNDPYCQIKFTASAYREMLAVLSHVSTRTWAESLPKMLPILLVAGNADPVGDYGRGVRRVAAMLSQAGIQDLHCRIWPGGRHEMHQELQKEEVFQTVYNWLQKRL